MCSECSQEHEPHRPAQAAADDDLLTDCVRSLIVRVAPDAAGWKIVAGDFWTHVQPPQGRSRVQGWKLHISATPLSAPLVLARSAEVLLRRGCAFKFAGTIGRVEELVSHLYDRGGGGKFITIYHDGNEDELRCLADELHEATLGLPGPGILSDRPCRPGSLVHYRFGVFTGVPMLSADGTYEAMLVAPDGTLVLDQRKAWFTPPAWAPRDPFADPQTPRGTPKGATPKPVLLAGRFVVAEVIRHAFAGGVFRASDQQTGASVVIKQARPHAGARITGHDVRHQRRHEAAMLELFDGSGISPRLVSLFEQQNELFLAMECIPGVNLRQWVAENVEFDGQSWGLAPQVAAEMAAQLVELIATVQAKGLVVRDFSPNNVIVTGNGELRLIDLEMLAKPGERVTRSYTPGYGAPEQVSAPRIGPAPDQRADLYSLGATLFYLVSGVDPILAVDQPPARSHGDRIQNWLDRFAAGNVAARCMAPIIVALLDADPQKRPSLADVRDLLDAGYRRRPLESAARPVPHGGLDQLVADLKSYLISTMRPDSATRLWPSAGFGATTDPLNVQHGAAGVVGVLVQASELDRDPTLRATLASAAGWVASRLQREPRTLPGLYFGRSGVAWALLEAGRSLEDGHLVELGADLARRVPLRWPNPDVCHGIAGAGLTQLRFWEVTGEADFLWRARQAADAVAAMAEYRDGLIHWPVASDFSSALAGLVHYGFAHGVAGVGAFLLAMFRATGDESYHVLATAAAATLTATVHLDRGAAYWVSGPDERGRPKTNWCSGSSGVATFLLRIGQDSGDGEVLDLAVRAATAIYRSRWSAGTAQCHGLAGDGEYLLDLADALGEEQYRRWAGELAVSIQARQVLRNGLTVVPDESGIEVVADFNTGLSGVLAFLLRLQNRVGRLWLPQLLAVSAASSGRDSTRPAGWSETNAACA